MFHDYWVKSPLKFLFPARSRSPKAKGKWALSLIVLAVVGFGAASLWADTLVRKDGRRFVGDIVQTDSGYAVHTAMGTINVDSDDVQEIIKGDAPAATAPHLPASGAGAVPATSASTRTSMGTSGGLSPVSVPAASGKPDVKTLAVLLQRGKDALAAGEWKGACEAFLDAAALDPSCVEALHGAGIAYMRLGDFTHASVPMEKAMLIDASPNRALVLNMISLQIALHNPMRGAKIARDYLANRTGMLDEPVLNALGSAIDQDSDSQSQQKEFFRNCVQFYLTYNRLLEAARPGFKRWGVEWLASNVVDEHLREVANKQQEIDHLNQTVAQDAQQLQAAQLALQQYQSTPRLGRRGGRTLERLQSDVDRLQSQYNSDKSAFEKMASDVPRQVFPKNIPLVAMDDLIPPPIGMSVVQVAQGNPSGIAATAPTTGGGNVNSGTTPAAIGTASVAIGDPSHVPPRVSGTAGPSANVPPSPASAGNVPGNVGLPSASNSPVVSPVAPPPVPQVPHKKVSVYEYAAAFPVADDLLVTSADAVQDASDLELMTSEGSSIKAQIVRQADGMALIRIAEHKLNAIAIASSFNGGPLGCSSYPTVNIFNPSAEWIAGNSPAPTAGWKVNLSRQPRLAGAPLIADGHVVGVELASRSSDLNSIPAATLDQLKSLIGSDAAASGNTMADPSPLILELMATHESK